MPPRKSMPDQPVIAKVTTKGFDVFMLKPGDGERKNPEIIVGRRHHPTPGLSIHAEPALEGAEPVTIDLEVGQNNYVSRQHLKIYYEIGQDRFFLRCLGKNGILVDDQLVRKNQDPVELPDKCVMRFPSTQIKLLFEALIKRGQDKKSESETAAEELLASQGIGSQASKAENSFGSPCPSPTGASSAQNSTPASPRHSGGAAAGDAGNNEYSKPPFSYAQLIVQAISSSNDRQMTLSGIYSYIQKTYPYYRTADRGWQNSIRHNLSLNRYFLKVPRNHDEPGKGSYWKIEPQSENKLCEQAFRKRRHRTITAGRSPHLFRSTSPGSPQNTTKEPSPNHGQAEGDFGSPPHSPIQPSESGTVSANGSVTTTPSTILGTPTQNGIVFHHPAFAQFKPNPAALRSFPGFFFATTSPSGQIQPGSPTYFIGNVDALQIPVATVSTDGQVVEGEVVDAQGTKRSAPEEETAEEVVAIEESGEKRLKLEEVLTEAELAEKELETAAAESELHHQPETEIVTTETVTAE